MKSFLKSLKRQDGFTLVELMVVVAIIGLLSAVAIPNFKKYQAKAKISEAKLQMSAAYTAEQAFFSDFNMYHTCLAYMGYNPAVEAPSRYYSIGFNVVGAIADGAMTSAANSGLSTIAADCPDDLAALNGRSFFNAGKGIGAAFTSNAGITTSSIGLQDATGTMLFTLGAAGIIDGGFITDATSSYLTINQAKVISNVRNGY
jgi:type IV pilus assembly protein PilA